MAGITYSDEIGDAALATFVADLDLKASGNLLIDGRYKIARNPDGDWGPMPGDPGADRQLFVCVESGDAWTRPAAMTLAIPYNLTIAVFIQGNPRSTYKDLAENIRDTAIKAILDNHGSSTWLYSAKQVLIDVESVGAFEPYQESISMIYSESVLEVTVIHGDS